MNPLSGRQGKALRILFAGMLGMVVAMGIGRFAFTPILPLMQRDLGMSHAVAGWLAGLNYAGYLIGALAFSLLPGLFGRKTVFAVSLLASIATTLLMGVTEAPFWWGTLRLLGGIASAVLFIVISAEVAEELGRRGCGHWAGSLYGGIGLGIALSGAVVPLLDYFGRWSGAWIGIGVLAALLAAVALPMAGRPPKQSRVFDQPPASGDTTSIRILAVAYFFEGLGYIVTGTFLVAIIAATPGLSEFAPWSWVAVGLAALPSTIIWPRMARRFGTRRALLLAYGLQSAGILVSVWADSIAEVLFVAVSFGGTFLAIVALVMTEGQRRATGDPRRAAAILTACFSLGQVLGPPLAGVMADRYHGFTLPLLLAATAVAAGGLLIALDPSWRQSTQN